MGPRIVHLIDNLDTGGAERVCIDLAGLQMAAGRDVRVVTVGDRVPLLAGASVRECVAVGPPSTVGLWQRWRWLRAQLAGADLVHVHMRHNLKYAWLAAPRGARLVLHDHFGEIAYDQSVPRALRWLLGEGHYVGVSKSLTDWARSALGVPDARVHLAPNVRVLPAQTPAGVEREPGAPWRLVAVGNHRAQKNLVFAVDVLAEVRRTHPASLTVYGAVVDPCAYAKVRDRIAALGLQAHVDLVADVADVMPLLGQFDLAVHPAWSESGPLVLIEYAAAGLPFLCSPSGDVAGRFAEEFGELFLEPRDPAQWAGAIRRLSQGKSGEACGAALRRAHRRIFSEQAYMETVHGIYDAALAG